MRTVLLICAVLLFLNGCTTAGLYENPPGSDQSVAYLKGTVNREASATWTRFYIEEIDEKRVFSVQVSSRAKFELTPGTHKILIAAGFNRGWGGLCPCSARLVVTADFESGKSYRLNGEVKDNRVLAWVENMETSERISEIVSEPYISVPL